jgi:Fic family protein
MPARRIRAEKKNSKRPQGNRSAQSRSKGGSRAKAPAKKQRSAKPVAKKRTAATTPARKPMPMPPKVAAKPPTAKIAPKAGQTPKTTGTVKGSTAKGVQGTVPNGAAAKPGARPPLGTQPTGKKKAGSAKEAKATPRRSSLRPPPPLKHYTFIGVPSFTGPKPVRATIPPPPPPPPKPPPATLEERIALVQTRLAKQPEEFRRRYFENFDMSWIYHDSALEGVVYSFQELKTALDSSATVVQDSSLQPICEEIRRHRAAIEFVRDFATKKRLPVTLDVVKKIYLILHPEEGDLKTVKYRKDIPQHRLYFHEYAPPDKIAYKVRQVVDWINDPETKRGRNALRIAARAHYDLLRVFPFTHDSGKVARLLMNLLLMRAGYEPAIVHSTERQRYYEGLKGSAAAILHMAQEAEENGLASVEKLLDEHETNTRSFVS